MNINSNLNSNLQHNRSPFNALNQNTKILKMYKYNDIDVNYSVIVPVYNQESIIVKNIKSIINNIGDTFEIIIILDYCFDNTKNNLLHFFNNYNNTNLNFYGVTIFIEETIPLFEATCDNIGFINSKGKYCLEIQADMEMTEKNFNLNLQKPFNRLSNLIAVSGRCAHNFYSNEGIGKLGLDIIKSIDQLHLNKNFFYEYETCNRGPLLIDKKKLKELFYLDERNWYLDNSDHDLMLRAYNEKKYICGYVPINFNSPINDGSTRKIKNNKNNENIRQIRINESKYKCDFNKTKSINYCQKPHKIYDLSI